MRKRKAPESRSPSPPPSRLERKLDDLVSILRHQADTGAGPRSSPGHFVSQNLSSSAWNPGNSRLQTVTDTSPSTSATRFSDNYAHTERSTGTTPSGNGDFLPSRPAAVPDVTFDRTSNIIQLANAGVRSQESPSPILMDVSVFKLPERRALEQLDIFQRVFLPTFPLLQIPHGTRPTDLQRMKPFLWLVIMALTTKSVREQLAMLETIWRIISQRIIIQQYADMDLLLGIVAFGAW